MRRQVQKKPWRRWKSLSTRERLYEALSLVRDWHAAAEGATELHQALQDRLRSRRAQLATTLAEAQPPIWLRWTD